MFKEVLKALKVGSNSTAANIKDVEASDGCASYLEESKFDIPSEESIMDYANKYHDFSKISRDDLEEAFDILRRRCPSSWNEALEDHAKAFHSKIMILRREKNLSKYIVPIKTKVNNERKECVAEDLVLSPDL